MASKAVGERPDVDELWATLTGVMLILQDDGRLQASADVREARDGLIGWIKQLEDAVGISEV